MIKNRTAQLIYQTIYCTIGVIGVVASFDFFDMAFFGEVYIYFSNWSNYFCLCVMLLELVNTIKVKENSFFALIPLLKFIGLVSILVTFFCYNFPDPSRNPAWNYKINSIAFHIVLPIMYIVDWFLFCKRKIKWTYPIYSAVFPITYLTFMFTRACVLNFDCMANNLYPYFFLNIEEMGAVGTVNCCVSFTLCYIAIGFVFIGFTKFFKCLAKLRTVTKCE